MPLPLLGEGREGVFHASLTQLCAIFRTAITKIPHPNPPLEGEGITTLAMLFVRQT